MLLTKLGILLMLAGLAVTVIFWIPKIVNQARLKEILGRKYITIYFFYFTNGPFLILVGYYLYQYKG